MTRQFQIDLFHAQLRRRGLELVDADGQPASAEEVRDLVELLVDPLGEEQWPEDETTKEYGLTTQKNLLAAMAMVSDASEG